MARIWTSEEIAVLRQHYPAGGSTICAELLGRGAGRIREKASELEIRTVCKNGRPPRRVVAVISDNRLLAVCPRHGVSPHCPRADRGPKCLDCDREYGRRAGKTEAGRAKLRAAVRRRRATLLGRYEVRLRNRLARLACGRISLSRDLPYTSEELCEHLKTVRARQGGCCPMCHRAYDDVGCDIDHVMPLASATSREEVVQLFALNNLSLLCPRCNRHVKRDRVPCV